MYLTSGESLGDKVIWRGIKRRIYQFLIYRNLYDRISITHEVVQIFERFYCFITPKKEQFLIRVCCIWFISDTAASCCFYGYERKEFVAPIS